MNAEVRAVFGSNHFRLIINFGFSILPLKPITMGRGKKAKVQRVEMNDEVRMELYEQLSQAFSAESLGLNDPMPLISASSSDRRAAVEQFTMDVSAKFSFLDEEKSSGENKDIQKIPSQIPTAREPTATTRWYAK